MKEYVEPVSYNKQDILLFMFVLVFGTITVAPAPKSIALALMGGFWILSGLWWTQRASWLKTDWLVPLLLMIAVPWVALFWSPDRVTGLKDAQRSVYWLYSLPAVTLVFRRYSPRVLMASFLAGLYLNVLVSFLQWMQLLPMYKGQGFGLLQHITLGLLLVAGLLFLAYFYREANSGWIRFVLLLGMVLLVWNLVIGASRAGYLGFLLALPWMLNIMFNRRQILMILLIGVFAISGMVLSPVVNSRLIEIRHDVEKYHQGNGLTSVGLRLHMWKGALKIWKEHPLLGVGTGGYRETYKKIADDPAYAIYSHPHNSVLYLAVSYGLVGLIIFAWLMTVVTRRAWLARATTEGFIMLTLLYVIAVGSLTDTQIMGHATGVLLGIVCGFPVSGVGRLEESFKQDEELEQKG